MQKEAFVLRHTVTVESVVEAAGLKTNPQKKQLVKKKREQLAIPT